MNNKTSRQMAFLFALLTVAAVFTSCNRGGYGCPYELSAPSITIIK